MDRTGTFVKIALFSIALFSPAMLKASYFPSTSTAISALPVDVSSIGFITGSGSTMTIALAGRAGVSVTLSGTWSASIIAELSGDNGTTWDQTDMFLRSVGTVQFAVGSNGL